MRFVLLFTLLIGCATSPVTYEHWRQCDNGCGLRGVKEACVTFLHGPACTCFGDFTFWVNPDADVSIETIEDDIDIMGF